MRTDILLGVLLTISVCTLTAQQRAEGNLSVSFVNAGLEAIKSIQLCRGSMSLNETGIVVPADTKRAIDRAEKTAKSDAEKKAVVILKALFQARLNTNMSRSMIAIFGSPTYFTEGMAPQPDAEKLIAASENDQRRCQVALRLVLHRRSYLDPPMECKNIVR